ncbi:MAG: hypothetical protein ACLTDS_08585 [Bianqueaceae bacterium]
MIPIVCHLWRSADTLLVLTVSAVLAALSAGITVRHLRHDDPGFHQAGCNHLEHVSTQMPYALMVAACCFVSYIVAGFSGNGWIGLILGVVLVAGLLLFFIKRDKKPADAPKDK